MAKRKVLKITPVLIALNILVLILIVVFYSVRLVKYYLKENGKKDKNEVTLLVDELKRKQSYLDETKGLVLDEETGIYTYKGDVKDNYVSYSGMLYRILSIDKEGNIKMVSEDDVTLLYPNLKNGYEKSIVNKWLNSSDKKYSGVYENAIVNSKSIITNTKYCNDVIDDVANITCDEVLSDYNITLLSLYDYKMAGGKESFLNNGSILYLGTLNKDGEEYYVTSEGEIALNDRESKAITVRPVITLNNLNELEGGNGKKESPYIIEKHSIKLLGDAYVNSIVKINDNNYKIIEVLDDKVKLTSTDVLMEDDKPLEMKFGGSTSAYSKSNTVGKYLNNTFLNSLDVKDYVVNSEYYIGVLSLANLDYASLRNSKVKTNVGMLTIGDMFVNETTNTLTLLRGMEASNIINVINEHGNLYADTISSKYNVRPAFYLKYDLEIKSGKGTLENPYELGVNNEQTGTNE